MLMDEQDTKAKRNTIAIHGNWQIYWQITNVGLWVLN